MKIHEHGHIVLEDSMGSDIDIVNAARVSFNSESDSMDDAAKGLIAYLMRGKHGTPFEHVVFKFDVKAPLFVFREWHRHRAGWSYNEWSARYSKIEPEFYVPQRDYVRTQVGKPGAYTFEREESDDGAREARKHILNAQTDSYRQYEAMMQLGLAKEIARVVLPVGTYSRMKATANLRSIFKFLELRNSEHAQAEIRDYAIAMERLVGEVCPSAMQAFIDNGYVCP